MNNFDVFTVRGTSIKWNCIFMHTSLYNTRISGPFASKFYPLWPTQTLTNPHTVLYVYQQNWPASAHSHRRNCNPSLPTHTLTDPHSVLYISTEYFCMHLVVPTHSFPLHLNTPNPTETHLNLFKPTQTHLNPLRTTQSHTNPLIMNNFDVFTVRGP